MKIKLTKMNRHFLTHIKLDLKTMTSNVPCRLYTAYKYISNNVQPDKVSHSPGRRTASGWPIGSSFSVSVK